MVEETSALVFRGPVGPALCAFCFFFSFASGADGEDGWRWRTDKQDDGRQLLAFTEAEQTDNFSGMSYYCKPSSGSVEVVGSIDKKQRRSFADLIRSDIYPEVKDEGSLISLSYADGEGWEYRFETAADGATFDKFKKTGQFGFTVGTILVDNGVRKAGLDKVAEFQAACRKPAADSVPNGSKAQGPFPETKWPEPRIGKP